MTIFNAQWTTFVVILGATVVSALIIKWFFQALTSPLNQYPGPFFAKWTNLWRFFVVRAGNSHITIRRLHQEYGPIVRLGPDILDLDYPELIKTLYGTDGTYLKVSSLSPTTDSIDD
ncbi:hypothetical protein CEP52_014980 [Fusarium oligoseptatum]|uniref:Uncharacterized protein n=1 Tax=Fusarium oligoseptatum TaxID=2604345 RepID=A0A428SH78_9HYPO|nr:hypothetical protein CEP52_014980 [Fusarium oligoseptatum]